MKEAIYLTIFFVFFSLLGIFVFAQTPPSPPSTPGGLDGNLPSEPCPPGETACTESDWSSTLTPATCPSTGQQTRTWTSSRTCACGVTHPSTETVSCTYAATSGSSSSSSSSGGGGSSSGGSSGSFIIPTPAKKNVTNATSNASNATVQTIQATQQTTSETQSQQTALPTQQSSASKTPVTEAPQSSSNLLFYVITGVFALLFIAALIFAISKLKKSKVPAQSFRPMQQQVQVNPQAVQLKNYILYNLNRGYTREQIATVLIQSGYSQQTIDEAMRIAS